MKYTLLLMLMFCGFGLAFSQTNTKKINDPNFKAITLSKSKLSPINSSSDVKSNDKKLNSEYMGLENYIAKRLLYKKFPSHLPKATTGQSKESYMDQLYLWAKNNLSLIKPEYYSEINDYKKQQ